MQVVIGDKYYPQSLMQIEDPPKIIYYIGDINLTQKKTIAVVGSRKMSEYGKEVCKYFTRGLVKKRIVTVSGFARGIDSVCHNETIEAKGKTIAVLGCGLDTCYPIENKILYKRIIDSGGLILSEYPIGVKPLADNFRARNRIISGLSMAVLVVEGEVRSGTLITANFAACQGKEVFAVPGNIFSSLSATPHLLIQNGAQLVNSYTEVLEAMDVNNCFN